MAASIIEGIDNEVLFVVSVLLAFVAILFVHLLYNTNSGQNVQNTNSSDSGISSSSDDRSQDNLTESHEATGARQAEGDPVTDELEQLVPSPSHNDATDSSTTETVNEASIPHVDGASDELRWRGSEHMPEFESQNSSPGDTISIRVKFMENERTLSVNKTITVGELKRLCFLNDLNSGRRVRLIYSGRLLHDDTAPISSYGVANCSVIHAQVSDNRQSSEHSTTQIQEADLDLSKLFLPILAVIIVLLWYGFFYHRHLFSAASVIILVFMTIAFGVLAHVMTS